MADRLAVMSDGEIVQYGSPYEVYEFPNSRFVAGFLGTTNLFTGTIVVDAADHVRIESDALRRPLHVDHGVSEALGMQVHVSIRPEHVQVLRAAPAGEVNWAQGVVSHVAWMGSTTQYQVRLESGYSLLASMPSRSLAHAQAPCLDDAVFVSWSQDCPTVLAS